MTIARQHIIDPSISQYYHCIARCVRRTFLCGEDALTGRDFNHRKAWLVERMKYLADIFSVEICAYAVMSNHYHLVLYWNIEEGNRWSDEEVVTRWCRVFPNRLGLAYLRGESLSTAEQVKLKESVVRWRKRLMDISWYMRCLNEYIAKKANQEDDCTGHFWEGRFRSQALLDEAALLSCMAYVDLNPVRTGYCEQLEDADYTSIQERIRAYRDQSQGQVNTPPGLLGFVDEPLPPRKEAAIPCTWPAYLQLVEWTGRSVRLGSRGSLPPHVPSLLHALGLAETDWLQQVRRFRTSRTLKMRGTRAAA